MARRTEVNFETFYNDATTGVYRAGQADGAIDSSDHRQMIEDITDCFDFNLTVDYASTAELTLSGTQTIDGVSVGPGNYVAVRHQSITTNNRIFLTTAGAWQSFRFYSIGDFIKVRYGNTNSGKIIIPTGTYDALRHIEPNLMRPYEADLNNITEDGRYYVFVSTSTNEPSGAADGYLYAAVYSDNFQLQKYFEKDNDKWYTRVKDAGVWSSWVDRSGSGAISGSTGSLDNALIRADGTGGSTIQAGALLYGTDDGRLYGTALHNNAGSMTGTTNQYIGSGTYTPTLTGVANVDSSTASVCQWIRVGNVVHVSGTISVNSTSTAAVTQIRVSLPIASNFGAAAQLGGTAAYVNAAGSSVGVVQPDTTNDDALFSFVPPFDSAISYFFSFTYLIV